MGRRYRLTAQSFFLELPVMHRLCSSLAPRAKSHFLVSTLVIALTLATVIPFSTTAFAQGSFMIGVLPTSPGGQPMQRGDF
jgi:hypothetical protein